MHVDKSIKKFKCKDCDFATHAYRYLNDHKRKEHDGVVWGSINKPDEDKRNITCKNCDGKFAHMGQLEYHVCQRGIKKYSGNFLRDYFFKA